MAVMIGVHGREGSHTAVALDDGEQRSGALRVRSADEPVERLLGVGAVRRADVGDRRRRRVGYLLAYQLVAGGERVVDVPAKLAARVRLLATGTRTRMTPTTPARWRSPRCAQQICVRFRPMIMGR